MKVRMAAGGDIELLIRLRMDYLAEEYPDLSAESGQEILARLRPYFERNLADGTLLAAIAEEEGRAVSVAFLCIHERPPNPSFPTGRTGTLLNVLTDPGFRRRGMAFAVLTRLMEEARGIGVSSIDLSATPQGRPLYEKLGFQLSPYASMKIRL